MVDSALKRCVWGASNCKVPLELVFLKPIAHKLKVGGSTPGTPCLTYLQGLRKVVRTRVFSEFAHVLQRAYSGDHVMYVTRQGKVLADNPAVPRESAECWDETDCTSTSRCAPD